MNAHRNSNNIAGGINKLTNNAVPKWKERLRKTQTLRIFIWNIRPWTSRDQKIIMELKKHHIDICAINETKKKGKGNIIYDEYILYYSVEKHGTAMADIRMLRVLILKISLLSDKQKSDIIIIYAPVAGKPQEATVTFCELHHALTSKTVKIEGRQPEVREIKKAHWEIFTKNMENVLYGSQKKVWKMIQNRKKNLTENFQTNKVIEKEWIEYFTSLYNEILQTTERTLDIQYHDDNTKHVEFTLEEIQDTITLLKIRKPPGPEKIPNEFMKYGGKRLAEEFEQVFIKIFTDGSELLALVLRKPTIHQTDLPNIY
ncbi:hypothetical protein FQA39_LY11094 [Lamprigera yunnana]|nr:hypothetical protein FQA39_LY11094 [Lamprigera yunnana]